jgi:hypothetical protein
MKTHNFYVGVAEEVGVNAAILYYNIAFWCERNEANGDHMHEGRAWTYNSISAFAKLFPYMSTKQIRSALDKLEAVGLLGSGVFNKSKYDRTKWYCPLRQLHLPRRANQFDPEGGPIPDVNTDITTNVKEDADAVLLDEEKKEAKSKADLSKPFDDFWNVYPKKKARPAAERAFHKAIKNGADPAAIITGAKRYALWLSSGGPKDFRPEAKFPQGWLNDERWNDTDLPELPNPDAPRPTMLRPFFGEVVR